MKKSGFVLLSTLATLIAGGPLAAQGFGSAVAVGNGEVMVAEPLNELSPGLVYVFRPGGGGAWTEHARLEASDAAAGDHFGRAIATDGNTLLVGATVRDSSTGAVYVFVKDGSEEWTEATVLTAGDGSPGDAFGRAIAISGDRALIASWAQNDNTGAVYVFTRDGSGNWSQSAKLVGSDVTSGMWFGQAVALDGDVALVGVPRSNQSAGAVYVFRRDSSGAWNEEAKLAPSDLTQNDNFGSTVAISGDRALLGAPGQQRFTGTAYAFSYDAESGTWRQGAKLMPFDGPRRAQFSAAIGFTGDEVWVGAPGAGGFEGRVYVMRRDVTSGDLLGAAKLGASDLHRRDSFAATLAARGNVAVVGATGDDYGAGTAIVFERNGTTGEWMERGRVVSEVVGLDPILGGEVDCDQGVAARFDCSQVDLVSFLPVQAMGGARGVGVNDLWGWTDPKTGKDYALVGRMDGTAFVDVSNPLRPRYLGDLPMTKGANGTVWRDIKVYKNHAYIVSDAAGPHGMQVFDLTRLRHVTVAPVTFTEAAHYDKIHSAHNIVIDEDAGFAFAVGSSGGGETCGGGLHMIDIREPEHPTFAGCFSDASTGRRKTGYTHDGQCVTYHGPDEKYEGKEICFGANETALSIADVTDKNNPTAVSTASYPNVGYTHQGWLTEDQRYFYMDDELDEMNAVRNGKVMGTRTLVWDVADLEDPILVKEYFSASHAIDHNLYIKGDYMYQANYLSGLRVLDIHDRTSPVEVGYFDSTPYGDNEASFGGSWSNYPFFKSGVVLLSSMKEGLFILKKKETTLIP
ncbi:MAG: choice-of-anchor B family protein [Gemmatimonadales bacterium]